MTTDRPSQTIIKHPWDVWLPYSKLICSRRRRFLSNRSLTKQHFATSTSTTRTGLPTILGLKGREDVSCASTNHAEVTQIASPIRNSRASMACSLPNGTPHSSCRTSANTRLHSVNNSVSRIGGDNAFSDSLGVSHQKLGAPIPENNRAIASTRRSVRSPVMLRLRRWSRLWLR